MSLPGQQQVYRNPLRDASYTAERVDQGVDFGGSGPVFALGPGRIVSVSNPGWPGGTFIAEYLTSGPLAGQYVYTAEDVAPSVRVGQRVNSGTVIGHLAGQMETGFAAGPPRIGESLARAKGEQAFPTAEGLRFRSVLTAVGVKSSGSSRSSGSGSSSSSSASSGSDSGSLAGLAIIVPVVLAAAALMVWGAARATGLNRKAAEFGGKAVQAGKTAGMAAAL